MSFLRPFHSMPCTWSHDFLPLVGAGRGESCLFSPLLWDLNSTPAFSFLWPPDGYCTHKTSSKVFQHSRPSTSSHARSGASFTGSGLECGSQLSTWREDSLLAALHHPHLGIRESSLTFWVTVNCNPWSVSCVLLLSHILLFLVLLLVFFFFD